ncbi:MAG: tetratricopeptide repeat protein, partial [Pyrinomonadaceae bacterium]
MSAKSFLVDTLASRLDIQDPAAGPIVDRITAAAPGDPKAHLLAGVYYERTFDAADLDRSLSEYEKAAELDPANYALWLAVAKARDRIGDADGTEAAFKRSSELAPNYADIHWAYGNFLLRQGHKDTGFAMIAAAAAANEEFSGPAVSIVFEIAGGDIAETRHILGNAPAVNAALTAMLFSQKRYADAVQAWSAIPIDLRQDKYKRTSQDLLMTLLNAHQFR